MAKQKNPQKVPVKEAFQLNKKALGIWMKYKPGAVWSMLFKQIVLSLTPYVTIYFSAQIINELAGARNPQVLTRWVVWTLSSALVLALVNAVAERWRNYHEWTNWNSQGQIYGDKLLSMDFCSVDDSKIRDTFSQMKQNANWGGWGLYRTLAGFERLIGAVTKIVGAIALSVTLFTLPVPESGGALTALNNPLLMAAILILLFAITGLGAFCANRGAAIWQNTGEENKLGNRLWFFFGYAALELSRALDTRIYRQEKICRHCIRQHQRFSPKGDSAKLAKGRMGAFFAASGGTSAAFTGLVYVFVGLKAWGGAFGVGSVTQYVAAVTALCGGLGDLLKTLGVLRVNGYFLRTTFAFMDAPNPMYQGSLSVEKRNDRKYEIEFRNVSFRYPASDEWALRNVSLKFRVGERMAVVGQNGSGKTTFIKLLCRLYDPTEGEILLNGIDIRKYDYLEYLTIFSVVFQDFQLLAFELGQNVAARQEYDAAKAEECLRMAGFGERLKTMPQGLETCLYKEFDSDGVTVSGGEAQKIALARALYKDAPFIVLDEPTAALDPIAEYEVYSKFNEIVADKTAIYISHRLSSCRFCSDIAVFDGGRLVQRGNHEQLLSEQNGKYHELWNAQAQYYTAKQPAHE